MSGIGTLPDIVEVDFTEVPELDPIIEEGELCWCFFVFLQFKCLFKFFIQHCFCFFCQYVQIKLLYMEDIAGQVEDLSRFFFQAP